mgnify:CR=1 FL=1
MLQQLIALVIITFFLARTFWQKQKGVIAAGEFIFWFSFWLLAALAVILLKWIDRLVAGLGFTASGIDVLLYVGFAFLFYILFRVRLRQEKLEREITKIVRTLALSGDRDEEKNKKIDTH